MPKVIFLVTENQGQDVNILINIDVLLIFSIMIALLHEMMNDTILCTSLTSIDMLLVKEQQPLQ